MGRVFQSHQKAERAGAFYERVLQIYGKSFEDWLDESQGTSTNAVEVEEAIEIIKHIVEYRQKQEPDDQIAFKVPAAEGQYTLGILHLFTGDYQSARDLLIPRMKYFLPHWEMITSIQ